MDRTFFLTVMIVISILLALTLLSCGDTVRLETHWWNGKIITVKRNLGITTVADYVHVSLFPNWPWNSTILSARDADSIHIVIVSDSEFVAEMYWLNQADEWFLADTLHIRVHNNMKRIHWKSPGPDGRKAKGL